VEVRFYTPHILLQEFIQCIMVVNAEVKEGEPHIISYPPTPQHSLFFYINDRIKVRKQGDDNFNLQPRGVLVGLQSTSVRLDVNRSHKAVRVGFQPGGMYRLLGFSMAEMIDGSYDATDVLGNEIEGVIEKLQEAESFDDIKTIIEDYLLDQVKTLKQPMPFDKAILELIRLNGNIPIEKVASMACLSLRQFERVSKERIGFSPKMFARLVRFSKAYRLRENFPAMTWTNIAHSCGYFDQMHFIRDFREFTGINPGIIEKELDQTSLRMQGGMRL
jgi:AraC-like DNA-binding protein